MAKKERIFVLDKTKPGNNLPTVRIRFSYRRANFLSLSKLGSRTIRDFVQRYANPSLTPPPDDLIMNP